MKHVKRYLAVALTLCLLAGIAVSPLAAYAMTGEGLPEQGIWRYTVDMGGDEVEWVDMYGGKLRNFTQDMKDRKEFNKKVIWNEDGDWDYWRHFRGWERTSYYVLGDYLNRKKPADLDTLVNGALVNNVRMPVYGTNQPWGAYPRWHYGVEPQTADNAQAVPAEVLKYLTSKERSLLTAVDSSNPFQNAGDDGPVVWSLDYKRCVEGGGRFPLSVKNRDKLIGVLTVFHDFKLAYLDTGKEFVTAVGPDRFRVVDQKDEYNYVSMTTNRSALTANMSTKVENSKTTSIQNTISKQVQESVGVTVGVSTTGTFKVGIGIASGSVSNTFSVDASYNKLWSTTDTYSDTVSETSTDAFTINAPVPPNSVAPIKMSSGTISIQTDYDYPVAITYTVDMYSFSVEVPVDSLDTTSPRSLHFEHMARFGGRGDSAGPDAAENLRLRQKSTEHERVYGGNGNANTAIDWSGAWITKMYGTDIAKAKLDIFCDNEAGNTYKAYINETIKYRPMSITPASITISGSSKTADLLAPEPLYPLSYVGARAGTSLQPITLGLSAQQRIDNIALDGYNAYSVPYYGFNQNWGHFELTNKDGSAHNGSIAKLVTFGSMLYVQGVSVGDVELVYVIDSGKYSFYNSTAYVTDANLRKLAIPVKVVADPAKIEKYSVTGSVTAANTNNGVPATVKLMQGSAAVGNAVTADAQGKYVFQNVSAGDGYTVTATYKGYDSATTSAFNVGANVTGKNLVIQKTSTAQSGVFGYINDKGGKGIPAKVTLTQMAKPVKTVTANVAGFYELGSLPSGAGYAITASYAGYIDGMSDMFTLGETAQKQIATLNLSPVPGSVLSATPARIAQQPKSMKAQKGENATFWVQAVSIDGGTLSYQWYDNATNKAIDGKKSAVFTPKTDKVGTASYYCIVTNKNESATGAQTAPLKSAVVKLTVVDENVTSIAGSQKIVYLLHKKEIKAFPVAAYTKVPAKVQLTWKSSEPKVVSVSGSKLKGLATGKAILTATAPSGKKFTLTVNVVKKKLLVKSVTISGAPKRMSVKQTKTLKGKFSPSTATGTSAAIITWKSDKPKVLSVDAAGKLTAIDKGKAKITMTAGGKSTSVTITVQ